MFNKTGTLVIIFLGIFSIFGEVRAASVNIYISGTLTFDEISTRDPALSQSVIDSVLGLLPDGSSLSAQFTVETDTPDVSPDSSIGDYRGAVTQASFLINGFTFPLNSEICNPNFDCKLLVQNDFQDVPTVGALDALRMTSQSLRSVELGTVVSTETGIIPGIDFTGGFIPFEPSVDGILGLFATDFDLVDSDAIFDPLTTPFDYAEFSIFLTGLWTPNMPGTMPTRLRYRVNSLQISDVPPNVVPVPAAFWMFCTALVGLLGFRKLRLPA